MPFQHSSISSTQAPPATVCFSSSPHSCSTPAQPATLLQFSSSCSAHPVPAMLSNSACSARHGPWLTLCSTPASSVSPSPSPLHQLAPCRRCSIPVSLVSLQPTSSTNQRYYSAVPLLPLQPACHQPDSARQFNSSTTPLLPCWSSDQRSSTPAPSASPSLSLLILPTLSQRCFSPALLTGSSPARIARYCLPCISPIRSAHLSSCSASSGLYSVSISIKTVTYILCICVL